MSVPMRLPSVALCLTSVACFDLTPFGGGANEQPGSCRPGGNQAWTTAALEAERVLPDRCPFAVLSNLDFIVFGFDVRANQGALAPYTTGSLRLTDATGVLRGVVYGTFFADPVIPFKWLTQLDVYAQPGNYVPGSLTLLEDSAHFDVLTQWGTAQGWLVLSGAVDITPGSMVGPVTVLAGQSDAWRAVPSWDTSSYNYSWIVDGTPVPNSNHARMSRSFSTVGAHTLTVLVQRADLSVDTISMATFSEIGVQYSGPAVLDPYTYYQWSVSPLGGTAPHTYAWYLDGNFIGSGANHSGAFNANESHYFDVVVTDALSNQGSTQFQFYTTSEGGGPVELRQPSAGTSKIFSSTATAKSRYP
jgi:hypothetical protein